MQKLLLNADTNLPSTDRGYFIQTPTEYMSSILDLNRDDLLQKLTHYGAVMMRGFQPDINQFSKFVETVSPQTAIDPARDFFAENVQLVNSGVDEIGLHCENGTTPLIPQIVWFYCAQGPQSGSQTTLCDGVQVWKHLSLRAKHILQSKKVKFSRNVPHHLWLKYVRHHFPQLANQAEIDQTLLDAVFHKIPGASANLNGDGSLLLSYALYLARPTFFGSSMAFANSLFGPSYNYAAPEINFENGDSLPEWLLSECRFITENLTTEIHWMSGDIIVIDNSRVMHGRRRITDPNRKLFTALGFLKESGQIQSGDATTKEAACL